MKHEFQTQQEGSFLYYLIYVNLNMQVFRLSLRCSWCPCSSGIWLCGTDWWVSNVSV